MDKHDRLQAALAGERVALLPLALWRHFHRQDRDPAALAQATAEFARCYDLDLVKLTPSGLYAVEDWGAEIVYPDSETEPPYTNCLMKHRILQASHWSVEIDGL